MRAEIKEQRLSQLTNALDQSKKNLNDKEVALLKLENESETSMKEIKLLLQQSNHSRIDSETEIMGLRKQVRESQEKMAPLELKIEDLKQELKSFEQALAQAVHDFDRKSDNVICLEKKVADLKGKLEVGNSKELSLQEEVMTLNNYIGEQKEHIIKLEKERDQHIDQACKLDQSQSELLSELSLAKADRKAADQKADRHEQVLITERAEAALEESRKINILR